MYRRGAAKIVVPERVPASIHIRITAYTTVRIYKGILFKILFIKNLFWPKVSATSHGGMSPPITKKERKPMKKAKKRTYLIRLGSVSRLTKSVKQQGIESLGVPQF